MVSFIDTHCHLDAGEFSGDGHAAAMRAAAAGVGRIVIPAIDCANFERVRTLASTFAGGAYALGIHPLCSAAATQDDLDRLDRAVEEALSDPRFVAIGEIGLDRFVDTIADGAALAHQVWLYRAQLKLAQRHGLPVLLHVRRAQDLILQGLRQIAVVGGIAHAFNGSAQQAAMFVSLGFRLGFGGAMTFERALQIRRHARDVPASAVVLETDSPDIAPAWLHSARNEPAQLPRIAQTLASLRGWTRDETVVATSANALAALPRLAAVPEAATDLA